MFLYKCSITHDPGSLGARVAITDLMQGLVLMYRVRRQIRVSYLFVTCLFRPLRILARVEIRYKHSIVGNQSLYGPYGSGIFEGVDAFCTDIFFFTHEVWRKKVLGMPIG